MSNDFSKRMVELEQADEELVTMAKEGDMSAFTLLSQRYHERIYRTLLAMTKNHEDADDLAQEAFLHAYRSLRSFKQKSSFYTWIYRIAVNLTLNHLRKHEKDKYREELSPDQPPSDEKFDSNGQSPEKRSLRGELRHNPQEFRRNVPMPR